MSSITSQPIFPKLTSTRESLEPKPDPVIVSLVPPSTEPCRGKTFVILRLTSTVGMFPDLNNKIFYVRRRQNKCLDFLDRIYSKLRKRRNLHFQALFENIILILSMFAQYMCHIHKLNYNSDC